jgi:hypothetical protein
MNQLMNTSLNPEYIITQVLRLVNSDKRSEIKLNANGGNSVLVVCPNSLEYQFIDKIYSMMPTGTFQVIDINEILISFVEEHQAGIDEMFDLLKGSVHQIFKAPKGLVKPVRPLININSIYLTRKV